MMPTSRDENQSDKKATQSIQTFNRPKSDFAEWRTAHTHHIAPTFSQTFQPIAINLREDPRPGFFCQVVKLSWNHTQQANSHLSGWSFKLPALRAFGMGSHHNCTMWLPPRNHFQMQGSRRTLPGTCLSPRALRHFGPCYLEQLRLMPWWKAGNDMMSATKCNKTFLLGTRQSEN